MKYLKAQSVCLLGLITFCFFSCSDDNTEKKIAAPGTMIATIEGDPWISNTVDASMYEGWLSISGTNEITVILSVDGKLHGEYEIDGEANPSSSTVGITADTNLYYSSNTKGDKVGDIIITEIDNTNQTVSGTFVAKVTKQPDGKTVELKDGSFTKIPFVDRSKVVSSFEAKVNGSNFVSASLGHQDNGWDMLLYFYDQAGNSINLAVPANVTPGTYSFGSPPSDLYFAMYNVPGATTLTTYASQSGSVTITEHDIAGKRIKGTFSFGGKVFPEGDGTVDVTDASFEVYY